MTEQYVNINNAISKIVRDMGVDAEYRWSDIKEWIGEVIKKVASQYTMVMANSTIQVNNHRGKLPCNLIRTIAVTYSGYRLRYGMDERHITNERMYPISDTYTNLGLIDNDASSSFNTSYWQDRLFVNNYLTYDVDGNLLESSTIDNTTAPTVTRLASSPITEFYTIDGDILKASFEEGIVEIDYIALYTDSQGYPLIPDNEHLKESLYWYVFMKMVGTGYKHPLFADRGSMEAYSFCEAHYKTYIEKARASLNFPSSDQVRSIGASYFKLMPNIYSKDVYNTNAESIVYERTATRQ